MESSVLVPVLLAGAVGAGVFAPVFLFALAPAAAFSLLANAVFSDDANRAGEAAFAQSRDALSKEVSALQRQAYEDSQRDLVRLADEHLSAGGLLDLKTLSYLAAMMPELLREASDQLAISVLQARQMLAHVRCRHSAESANQISPKPPTFSHLAFDRRRDDHRALLREILEKKASSLAEDQGPSFSTLATPATPRLQIGIGGWLARTFAGAFFIRRDRRAQEGLQLPDVSSVTVPALTPIENFSDILSGYELANGRLDLPALRGWGGKRPLPPASRRPFLPASGARPAFGL